VLKDKFKNHFFTMRVRSLILFLFFPVTLIAQTRNDFDGSFEGKPVDAGLPGGWIKWGTRYDLSIDDSIYHSGHQSLRILPAQNKGKEDFGSSAFAIPIDFAGSAITLNGYLKMEQVEHGDVGLLMRIDGKDEPLGFDNMQQQHIHGTADWKKYSITLPLKQGAKTLFVGALHTGTGKLWVDDLEVLVDGKPLKKAALAKLYGADGDTAFDKGSRIQIAALTSEQQHHLEVLGKMWGFLKYYHPSVAAGNYNWDYELFRILPVILNGHSKAERNDSLLAWVNKFPLPANRKKASRIATDKIKMPADLDWITDQKELGTALTAALKNIADYNRDDEHYYIGSESAGNPAFKHERSYGNMLYPDAGFRLLALFRYWNMIQYFFPYKYLITEGWNNKLEEYIPAFIAADGPVAYQTALLRLISAIHDSHAGLYGPNLMVRAYNKSRNLPLLLKFAENKLIVIKTKNGAGELRAGDVITAVNGKPVEDVVKERLPTTSASNYATQLYRLEFTIFRTTDSVTQLTYERAGSSYTTSVATLPSAEATIWPETPATSWKLISSDVGYVYPGLFKNTQMDSMINAFVPTRGMVIDLRSYPSDNMLTSLAEYVLPERLPFVKFTAGSIEHPGMFTYSSFEMKAGHKNKDYYKGKVIILVNATTQSNAEFVTMALRLAPRAVVLGSTTAGADGNVSNIKLPGGVETIITGIGVYYPDGRETQRIGIVPDIVMEPTVKGIRENRDELLEKALSLIRE
jgi:C-terminal processing protease CtpA/Prc